MSEQRGGFAGWLRSRDDDALAALLVARPDLAIPVPADGAVLAARAGVPLSVRRATESLNRFELVVLDAVAAATPAADIDAVAALLGPAQTGGGKVTPKAKQAARGALSQALDRLTELALVWGDGPLHAVPMPGDRPGAPPRTGRGVREAVAAHLPMELVRLAGALDPDGVQLRDDAEAINRIATILGDTPALVARLRKLPGEELAVLSQLRENPVGTVRGARDWAAFTPDATPVRRLLARGLLIATGTDRVELVREVSRALRIVEPVPADPTPPALHGTPVTQANADAGGAHEAAEAVRRVDVILAAWGTEPPPVLRAGGLGVRELKAVARITECEEPVVALLLESAMAAGLLAATDDLEPTWRPTPAYDLWRTATIGGRWATLVNGWLSTNRVASLIGDRDDRGRALPALGPDLERSAAKALRTDALQTLAHAPTGVAPDPQAILARLSWEAPLRLARLGTSQAQAALTEAAVLGLTGRGALTSYGRLLLDGRVEAAKKLDAVLPKAIDHVLIQADLTAVAPGPLAPELARELALCADIESPGAATVYRFSETSLRTAYDAGRTAAELHTFLASISSTPVPQSLTYLVDDVARRHGALRVGGSMSYLRSDDPTLLGEVVANRRAHSLGLRSIAPTVVVCNAAPPRVLEVLRGAGYAPMLEAADGAVLLGRADLLRAPAPRKPPNRPESPVWSREQAVEAVRRIRQGDKARRLGGAGGSAIGERVADRSSAATLGFLQAAVTQGRPVWLGYVTADAVASERVVAPVSVGGGYLTAYDETAGGNIVFSLHRITWVAPVEA